MLRTFIAFSLLGVIAAEETSKSAAECITDFAISNQGCPTLSAFAQCIEEAPKEDTYRKTAEKGLLKAQKEFPKCELTVAPSFRVVDRELRVVTQEDVRFQRFRRDEVGVFELKDLISNNTDKITNVEETAAAASDAVAALSTSSKTGLDNLGTKLQEERETDAATAAAAAAAVDESCKAGIAALKASLKEQKEEAEAAAASEVVVAASWLFTTNPIHPTNRIEAIPVEIIGDNFAQYDYSPATAEFFKCTFALATDSEKVHTVTYGKTHGDTSIYGPRTRVLCPTPRKVTKKTVFQLQLSWMGGEDEVAIPFKGAEKQDLITFDMTWSTLKTVENTNVIVDVDGLDLDEDYTCKFTQEDNDEITKSADGAFITENGKKMNCGAQPTGFAISGTTAAVEFELFIKGTKTKASYAGVQGGGPVVQLNTCRNGKQDGSETDKDCGGECSAAGFPCGPNTKCKEDADCQGKIPCTNKICGLDGKTQENAAKTCKSIKIQMPDSKNGFYFVTGPNDEYTKKNGKGPKKVFCWQEGRDGGGWTLGMKHWYGQHHSFVGGGSRQTGNINGGVMDNLGAYYKMDDREIRTYMGQPNPESDADGANCGDDCKSEMEFMRDQSDYNKGHSNNNREYTVMKKYTGRWRFHTWTRMQESTTKSELTSWAMPKHYEGGVVSVGDGKINWRGNPVCGNHGGTGISCHGTPRSGSPQTNPNGGAGCNQDLGRGHRGGLVWTMIQTNYDTYTYFCAGAQHSSSQRFSSRTWFRSPESQKDW